MLKKLGLTSAIALLGALMFVPAAGARPPHVRVGVGFGPGPGWGWGYWGAYNPYYYGGYYVSPPPTTGKLKVDTSSFMKDDAVYIDGGYVGTAKHVKDLPLAPGTHSVEVLAANGAPTYQNSVNIELGHTTTVHTPGA